MNKFSPIFRGVLAFALMVTICLSFVACGDNSNDNTPETPECKHENTLDGKCFDCGKIFVTDIADLTLDEEGEAPCQDGTLSLEFFYVEATVTKVVNNRTGEMIIEDSTGSIRVQTMSTKDGVSYNDMESKPDAADKILIHCNILKSNGEWVINTAHLISFEAIDAPIQTITVAEALELCGESGNVTTERYYIRATVVSVTNPAYGAMIIADETGEIEVYGTYSADGSVGYADMTEKPVKGDEVLLSCILQNYSGTKEVKNAWLIEFTHVEIPFDESNYTEMTIADARNAEEGALVKVSGVVAQITYANGYIPSGVILVDSTSSIYVYDGDIAGQAAIGNTITVAGGRANWILDSEISNAQKFGYTGACQLDNAVLLANDKGNTGFDKSWITETTVKEIMDTPVTENITNKIFKVNALVKKAPGNGFTNYYIDDIDGVTGSYVYTQCNGGDFEWLDEFDGKICTVYFVAINAKSTSSGCLWRFLPIEVIDEGYEFDLTKAAEYAVKYHGVVQFLDRYTGDPAITLTGKVDSDLLGFEGALLTYVSDNEAVIYFTEGEDGVVTFHCGEAGKATVTVTATHGENTYSENIEIAVVPNVDVEYIEVADAIKAEVDSTVTVKGVVGPSVVNKQGFYFFGEDGSVITVLLKNSDDFSQIAIGNEIILTGMRERYVKDDTSTIAGQTCIVDAEIIANYYGNHPYSTAKFVTEKTVENLRNDLDATVDYSTTVFITQAKVVVEETDYYTSLKLTSIDGNTTITLYCSGAGQYSWLKPYAGQTVTLELAACNWNDKSYWAFCALALVNEDGSKIYNELNFGN